MIGTITSIIELEIPGATRVKVTDDTLTAELADGRVISVPLTWHPRLIHANSNERDYWELYAEGQHIHWPDLDEDISVEGMVDGKPSGEGERFLNRWLEAIMAGCNLAYCDLMAYEKEQ